MQKLFEGMSDLVRFLSSSKNKNQSSIYYFSFSLLLIFFLFLFINKYTNYNLKKNIKDRYQSVINKIKTPSVATLSLRGSPPGTRIFIDGTPTATLKGLGHLHEFTLSPGTKLIQAIYQPINGQKYTTFQTGISLKPGSQVFLGNIQLLPLSLVRLTSNSNASITINGAVSYQVKASKPIELHLQSGHYRLEAHANTRPSHKIFKRVEAKGQHVKVEFNFP